MNSTFDSYDQATEDIDMQVDHTPLEDFLVLGSQSQPSQGDCQVFFSQGRIVSKTSLHLNELVTDGL